MSVNISLDELIQRGAHFGHQKRRWNPKMAQYLYGISEGVHIFDLVKTKASFEEALEFLKEAKKKDQTILLLGTKKQIKDKVKEVANELGLPYVNERWLGGTLTNFEQIKKSIDKLNNMRVSRDLGEYKKYTKKERLLIDREIERLNRFLGGLVDLKKIPDVMFIIDVKKEATAVIEANRTGVKVVAVVDTNCDPDGVDYIIPMNDDATKALEYLLDLIKEELKSIKPSVKATDKKNKPGKMETVIIK